MQWLAANNKMKKEESVKLTSNIKTSGFLLAACLILLGCNSTHSTSSTTDNMSVTPQIENIRGHMDFLAHDLLEGRDTGSQGHEIASLYIATEFQRYGLKTAGENDTFMQRVRFRKGLLVQE
jgi:hypothetical protein